MINLFAQLARCADFICVQMCVCVPVASIYVVYFTRVYKNCWTNAGCFLYGRPNLCSRRKHQILCNHTSYNASHVLGSAVKPVYNSIITDTTTNTITTVHLPTPQRTGRNDRWAQLRCRCRKSSHRIATQRKTHSTRRAFSAVDLRSKCNNSSAKSTWYAAASLPPHWSNRCGAAMRPTSTPSQ